MQENLKLMPGINSIMNFFIKKNIPLAIATSGEKTYVEYWLKKFNIIPFFKTIVTINDVKRGKPHPDLINEVLIRMECKPDDAIILEDSPNGIEAAAQAGVFSVAIPTERVNYDKFPKANIIVNKVENLERLFSFIMQQASRK